jgi:hypothetical protein
MFKAEAQIGDREMHPFRWVREYQEALIAHVEETVRAVAIGLAIKLGVDPNLLKKSVDVDLDVLKSAAAGESLGDPDDLMLKSILSRLKSKYKDALTRFKKFNINNNKPLAPMEIDGKITYNPKTGKPLTAGEWDTITNSVVDFLDTHIGGLEEETVVRAGLFGLLAKKMEDDGIGLDDSRRMSWDDVSAKYRVPETLKEARQEYGAGKAFTNAIAYAQAHAAKDLAIDDGTLKNKVVGMVRANITAGLQEGLSPQQMAQRLFWIDPSDEVGRQFDDKTVDAINRDWRRVAITETAAAFSNGYTAAVAESRPGKASYFIYGGRVNPDEGGNEPCNKFIGVVVRYYDKPLADDVIDDPHARYAIWPGKNNVGRRKGEQWICIPTHPHCKHFWLSFDPETQEWDPEVNKVIFKVGKSATPAVDLLKADRKLKFLVLDTGESIEHASRLEEDGHDVTYFTSWAGEPTPKFRTFVPGLGLIKKTTQFFRYVDKADVVFIPAVGFGDLARYLRRQGKAVWGGGPAEILELNRAKSLGIMDTLGIKYPRSQICTGFEELREYLRGGTDLFIKFNKFRGDVETFGMQKWDDEVKMKLNQLEGGFGPFVEDVQFVVQDKVEGAESGWDLIFNGREFVKPYLWGYEYKKTQCYVGRFADTLPDALQDIADRVAPYLRERDYRGFISIEVMVDKKGRAYLIDWTCRAPYPMSTLLAENVKNFPAVVAAVANGQDIELDVMSPYSATLNLSPTDDIDKWRSFSFKNRKRLKLYGGAYANGRYWLAPYAVTPALVALGFGETVAEALSRAEKAVEKGDIDGLDTSVAAANAETFKAVIANGRKCGLDF